MTMTVESLAALVRGDVRGDATLPILGAQALEKAAPTDVTFVVGEKNLRRLRLSAAGAVVAARSAAGQLGEPSASRAYILVDDPQGAFLRILETLRPRRPRPRFGVSHHAFVHPTARVGANTNIHPGAHIGENTVIGDHCDIHPAVVIGPGCVVGDSVTIYPNAVLYEDVAVGNRVIIHAGAILGADGFGFRLVDGEHRKIPHFGTVRIEDDVEIGACTTIDRAMIGATVIGRGTKIDNLVMIAHNCEVGRHNILVSQVALAGSVTTGDYVVCAGQAGVADHVHLGDGCVLGAKAGAHKDMPGGQAYLGAPAIPEGEAIKAALAQRKLPELRQQVRQLEARVAEMAKQLQSLLASREPGANAA